MKNVSILLLFVLLVTYGENQNQSTTETATVISDSSFFHPASIKEQVTFQCAIEAAIWGIPAVNFQLM